MSETWIAVIGKERHFDLIVERSVPAGCVLLMVFGTAKNET